MKNIKVNDFFDQVYLINLKRRPDKLKISTDLLNKLGIQFKLFEAIDFCDGIPEDYPVKTNTWVFLRHIKTWCLWLFYVTLRNY